jgi:hypothetical protein
MIFCRLPDSCLKKIWSRNVMVNIAPRFSTRAWLAAVAITMCFSSLTANIRHPHPERPLLAPRALSTFSLDSLDRLAEKISARQNLGGACAARMFGSGFGHHMLCTQPRPARPCYFYSFGISYDYSFDSEYANATGCVGVAADPTVTYPSKLQGNVFFLQMAAASYDPADLVAFPLKTTVPGLRFQLGHERLAVLKMDCEGCEYSLARDVLAEDPDFFGRIDNFVVEIHYSKRWIKSVDYLHSLAALLHLLEDAGLELIHFELSGCSPQARATGLIPELASSKLGRFLHLPCHNYLFARL